VLLPGGGQTRHSWRSTGQALAAAGWRAVAVDLRGHGESDWSPHGYYDLDRFAADVSAIVDFLGRAPVLVGASLGGNAALAALGDDPALALGLVLIDVSPFVQSKGTRRVRDFMMARPDGFASIEEAANAVAAYQPQRRRPTSVAGLRRNLREIDGRLFWHWDPALPTSQLNDDYEASDPARLAAAAATVRVPTLLVRGGKSDVLSIDDARRFLTLVPHAEFCDVREAHHMVVGDENTAFGAALGDFLERRIRPRVGLATATAAPPTQQSGRDPE
jgi:pimeloyl-ACP methyl ester carboxylesterase